MKKPFLLLSLLLTFGLHADCAAWGTVGHRAIAEVAQRHLTPKAKAAIERYTGGTPLAEYAVFMDEVAADPRYKEPFRGWHASIADAECNSPAEVREKYRKGRDGVTGAETLTAALKNYRELDDSVVLTYIKCIVHMVADFHCPAHVRYTDAHNEGKFDVTFFSKPKTLHSVWDSGVIAQSIGMELRTLCRLPRQRLQARNPANDRRIVPPVVRRRRTRRTPLDRLGSAGRHAGRGVHGKSRTAGRAAAPQGVVPVGRSPQPDFRRVTLPCGATGVYHPIAERRRGERSNRHDSYFPIFRPFMSNASAHPSAIM